VDGGAPPTMAKAGDVDRSAAAIAACRIGFIGAALAAAYAIAKGHAPC
jgi:hypothetical protein